MLVVKETMVGSELEFLHPLGSWLIAVRTEGADLVVHTDLAKVANTNIAAPALTKVTGAAKAIEWDKATAGVVRWVIGVPFDG